MKTPSEILVTYTVRAHAEHGEFLYDAGEIKEAMKEYAKMWVEQVVKEIADVPPNNLITYYHLAIDAQ